MNNYNNDLNEIFNNVQVLIEETRRVIYEKVNTEMIYLYWNIGKSIIKMQEGKPRAEYGKRLLEDLSRLLTEKYGKGFSYRMLRKMRQFYFEFSIWPTVSAKLSWSHYVELIQIKDKSERDFYMKESIEANWDVRTLIRQRKSCLYERLIISGNKENKELLPVKGQVLKRPKDLVKDPYILEFLDLKNNDNYNESELEKNILSHLKEFMLELGKGFMFVGSQERIRIDNTDFYVDLVFYNRIVNCHVLMDLKVGRITHRDIGQMEAYVSFYNKYVKTEREQETIGILLGTTKNNVAVKLTIKEESEVYESIYKLHFPSKEELINIIEEEKQKLEGVENICE